ncbi:hypothetical protein TNCV_139011 [Trichonephila clavipes]|nr:hypothetical protein TNCV_139011 [Trichonephila clavipes]
MDCGTSCVSMLRQIFVGTTAPGHHDCQFQGMKKELVIMALYRSRLTVTLWPSSFFLKDSTSPIKRTKRVSFSGCNGVSTYTCGLASSKCGSFLFVDVAPDFNQKCAFIAKQRSAYEIGNNGNRFGPFDESPYAC